MQTNAIQIPENDIVELYERSEKYLSSPIIAGKSDDTPSKSSFSYKSPTGRRSTNKSEQQSKGLRAALLTDEKSTILTPNRHAVLFNATRALAVGEATGELFVDPLGYIDLATRKRNGRLSTSDTDRFSELVRAKALVSVFVAAAFIASKCSSPPSIDNINEDVDINLKTTSESLQSFAGILVKSVEGVDDENLEEAVGRAMLRVMTWAEHQSHRVMGNNRSEFEAKNYAVEADSFNVHGFQRQTGGRKTKASTFQFKKPKEVVGNHVAKSQAMKLAKMLVSYDFKERENPFVRLGGFTFTIMGDGNPGTGKTTLIQMACGLIKDYCDVADYPYHFENLGIDQISEFQGKSGQNARAFIDRILDPRVISFGTIDDIDQVAGKRDDNKSSSGQQEVTAVLMDAFAGASTLIRGNCSFGMFSNYPEKVDDALRQRAGARWLVDGPQTMEDYIDIFHLLIGDKHKIELGDHDLFAAQEIKEMTRKTYDGHSKPHEKNLKKVFDTVLDKYGEPETIADVGRYLHAIREAEDRFTGRAIKNITDAIKTRSMDIDLPDEWFENPERYLNLPFEKKCQMLEELRMPITMDMVMQEINRYADSEFRYSAKSDEAAINEGVRAYRISSEVKERVLVDELAGK